MKKIAWIALAVVILLALGAAALLLFRPANAASVAELERPLGFVQLSNGRLLITDGGGIDWNDSGSEVMIVDRKGRVQWSFSEGLRFAHSAIMLKNGNVLIPDTNNNRLLEVSPAKKVVWDSNSWGGGKGTLEDGSHLNYPNYVQELADNRFLVSDRLNSRVIEVDREGRIYWKYAGANKQHAPKAIAGGRYLIADSDNNRIIEIDRGGKILWQYSKGLAWPRDAFILDNGNMLITDSRNSRVIEVARSGRLVREIRGMLAVPYQASPVRDGNILISDSQHARVIEVNKRGRIVWQFRNLRRKSLSRNVINGDIENLDNGWYPTGWIVGNMSAHGSGRWLVDHTHRHSGDYSLSIQASGNSLVSKTWGQRIRVKPGARLLVSSFIQTKDVRGGATITIAFQDPLGGPAGGVNIPVINGTNDWKKHAIIVDVPKKVKEIQLGLTLLGVGQVWFDDITLDSYPR